MNDVLNNLFDRPKVTSTDGLVSRKAATDLWVIKDSIGRELTAKSTENWRPGVDWVTVQGGLIIGRAKRRGPLAVYTV